PLRPAGRLRRAWREQFRAVARPVPPTTAARPAAPRALRGDGARLLARRASPASRRLARARSGRARRPPTATTRQRRPGWRRRRPDESGRHFASWLQPVAPAAPARREWRAAPPPPRTGSRRARTRRTAA